VLLIPGEFPPVSTGRAEKALRRCKYLARDGWDVTVLTPALGQPHTEEVLEPIAVEGAPGSVRVLRTGYPLSSSLPSLRQDKYLVSLREKGKVGGIVGAAVGFALGYARWAPVALLAGTHRLPRFDVVLSFSNPIMLHPIGWCLSRLAGVPWTAELRDQIVGYSYNRRGGGAIDSFAERWILRHAELTLEWADAVEVPAAQRVPTHLRGQYSLLRVMGYDPDRYDPERARDVGTLDGPFRIVFTGSTYGRSIGVEPFLRGLHRFVEASGAPSSKLEVVFAGDWSAETDSLVQQLGLGPFVRPLGRISPDACVRLWGESSLLLLVLGHEQDNLPRIPSKFWDYVGARRPILCLGPKDALVRQIVHTERLGVSAENTPDAVEVALRTSYDLWSAGKLECASEPFWRTSSCVPVEGEISALLRGLVKQQHAGGRPARTSERIDVHS
jgi:hypothetical protein